MRRGLRGRLESSFGPDQCVSTPTMTLVAAKWLVFVTDVSSCSTELAPADQGSGQDCEGAYGQAPMRSLLNWSVGLVGRLENESTDHIEGIAPVPLLVRPERRRPLVRLSRSHYPWRSTGRGLRPRPTGALGRSDYFVEVSQNGRVRKAAAERGPFYTPRSKRSIRYSGSPAFLILCWVFAMSYLTRCRSTVCRPPS